MERAMVFVDDHVIGIRFRGQMVVTCPLRKWEPTRIEDGTQLWASRERTKGELFELTSQFHTKARKINENRIPSQGRLRETSGRPKRRDVELME